MSDGSGEAAPREEQLSNNVEDEGFEHENCSGTCLRHDQFVPRAGLPQRLSGVSNHVRSGSDSLALAGINSLTGSFLSGGSSRQVRVSIAPEALEVELRLPKATSRGSHSSSSTSRVSHRLSDMGSMNPSTTVPAKPTAPWLMPHQMAELKAHPRAPTRCRSAPAILHLPEANMVSSKKTWARRRADTMASGPRGILRNSVAKRPTVHHVNFGMRYSFDMDGAEEAVGKRVSAFEEEKKVQKRMQWLEERRLCLGDDEELYDAMERQVSDDLSALSDDGGSSAGPRSRATSNWEDELDGGGSGGGGGRARARSGVDAGDLEEEVELARGGRSRSRGEFDYSELDEEAETSRGRGRTRSDFDPDDLEAMVAQADAGGDAQEEDDEVMPPSRVGARGSRSRAGTAAVLGEAPAIERDDSSSGSPPRGGRGRSRGDFTAEDDDTEASMFGRGGRARTRSDVVGDDLEALVAAAAGEKQEESDERFPGASRKGSEANSDGGHLPSSLGKDRTRGVSISSEQSDTSSYGMPISFEVDDQFRHYPCLEGELSFPLEGIDEEDRVRRVNSDSQLLEEATASGVPLGYIDPEDLKEGGIPVFKPAPRRSTTLGMALAAGNEQGVPHR